MINKIKAMTTTMFLLFTSVVFAQNKNMIIEYVAGGTTSISVSSISKITFGDICPASTVDYGGVTYNTVAIGSQCWLKENLRVGTKIAVTSNQTNNSTIEKYCYDDNDANCVTYGGLYQWAEAVAYTNGATNSSSPSPAFSGNIQGICPTGWHLPTKTELEALSTTVGGDGNALKAVGQGTGAGAGTNTSGFAALLSGYRSSTFNNFVDLGRYVTIWSSTEDSGSFNNPNTLLLANDAATVDFTAGNKTLGLSVRCVRD